MSPLPKKHVAVLPYPPTSHARPLANLVFKLATAAPQVHFSFLATFGYNDVLAGSDRALVNVQVHGIINSPWANPLPGESDKEMQLRFFEGAPTNFEMAIRAAEEAVGARVSCLLTDAFFTFACKIAEKMQVKWVPLYVGSPYIASVYIQYSDIIRKYLLDDDKEVSYRSNQTLEGIPGLSRMRLRDLPDGPVVFRNRMLQDTFVLVRVFRELGILLPRADAIVMSSFEEVNSAYLLEDLKSRFKELLLVGSLTASLSPPPLDPRSDGMQCLAWLDQQKHRSVAYICFGSVISPPPEEISMLAEALEARRTPYLWSLKDELKLHLLPGFEERTSSHGKIVPWAPQNHVLWHPSIGAYVTHCGYNSMFESAAAEVPLICRPVWADNRINAVAAEEEWGIGLMVDGGTITKNGMIKCLEMVMGGGEVGKEMRMKIEAFKKVLMDATGPSGSASRNFKTLVDLISS